MSTWRSSQDISCIQALLATSVSYEKGRFIRNAGLSSAVGFETGAARGSARNGKTIGSLSCFSVMVMMSSLGMESGSALADPEQRVDPGLDVQAGLLGELEVVA